MNYVVYNFTDDIQNYFTYEL